MSMAMQIKVDRLEKLVAVLREDMDRLSKVIDRLDLPNKARPRKDAEAA